MNNKSKQYLEILYKFGKSMSDIRESVDRLMYGERHNYSCDDYVDSKKYEFEFMDYHTDHTGEDSLNILDESELNEITFN